MEFSKETRTSSHTGLGYYIMNAKPLATEASRKSSQTSQLEAAVLAKMRYPYVNKRLTFTDKKKTDNGSLHFLCEVIKCFMFPLSWILSSHLIHLPSFPCKRNVHSSVYLRMSKSSHVGDSCFSLLGLLIYLNCFSIWKQFREFQNQVCCLIQPSSNSR